MVFNRAFEGQGICVMGGVIVFMFSDQLQFLHPMNYLLSNYFLLQVTVASFLSLVFFFVKWNWSVLWRRTLAWWVEILHFNRVKLLERALFWTAGGGNFFKITQNIARFMLWSHHSSAFPQRAATSSTPENVLFFSKKVYTHFWV